MTTCTFKSILVGLAPVDADQAASGYALSLGAALGAHVTGCSYAISPDLPSGSIFNWVSDDIAQRYKTTATEKAAAAIERFEQLAHKLKVPASSHVLQANLSRALTSFGEEARVHDLAVVTQSERGIEHAGDLFAESALFYSGRPFILVPRDHTAEFSAHRLLIAWDGSQYAARAIAHAMPILGIADHIEVLVVRSKEKAKEAQAVKIVQNLERHGLNVDLSFRDESDDASTIAREAKVSGASMLIMGGYGHSRAREIFFGGVTRYMMSETPLPVFMAH